ncbi:hypothetical protein MKK65_02515 [Methylobacterium sp. J-001]|uniref:hypothetical protein n=1 Tax=Methylobacterium sp. J-001 TaxID=2836609 RepID=UPI001FB89FB0|nr:hypothetical protein [Methylobacterium sp. J-001]MCJ2115480.1 hypothetical protein [Methylobacterium sp. J-001]
MKTADPIPTRLLKAKVHSLAEDAAARLKFKAGDPLEPVVVRLGGRIEYKTAEVTADKLPESIIVIAQRFYNIPS